MAEARAARRLQWDNSEDREPCGTRNGHRHLNESEESHVQMSKQYGEMHEDEEPACEAEIPRVLNESEESN